MCKDEYVEIGHVIACHDHATLRRDIFSALPITAHKKIEDWNDEICADFKGEVCAEWIPARWLIADFELRHS